MKQSGEKTAPPLKINLAGEVSPSLQPPALLVIASRDSGEAIQRKTPLRHCNSWIASASPLGDAYDFAPPPRNDEPR
ncbi:MAG: hypothetical protein LBE71_05875 [Dysgonamonadaceae bacterium]|nr:hypothetical protein [Dysgonamonadaceae bacterium]